MFTTPDNADAAPTCPAFDPVGPVSSEDPNATAGEGGFFKDCQTIPTAEDFNELIINLRRVVRHAVGHAGTGEDFVKGADWMLELGILGVPMITYPIDLYVAPTGVNFPATPLAGNPFSRLEMALWWLSHRRLQYDASCTIHVANGVYNPAGPIELNHPDGARISIIGESRTNTIFAFLGHLSPGGKPDGKCGFRMRGGAWGGLSNLQIQGNGQTDTYGLEIDGGHLAALVDVYLYNWGNGGQLGPPGTVGNGKAIWVRNGGYLGASEVEIYTAGLHGIHVSDNGVFSVLGGVTMNEVGWVNAPAGSAGLCVERGGTASINVFVSDKTQQAILVDGPGSSLSIANIHAGNSNNSAAVEARNGGAILNNNALDLVNAWQTWNYTLNTPQYFLANYNGLIRAKNGFLAANRANCSPAVNTVGNIQAYIQAL